jgi:hypothetical protein
VINRKSRERKREREFMDATKTRRKMTIDVSGRKHKKGK